MLEFNPTKRSIWLYFGSVWQQYSFDPFFSRSHVHVFCKEPGRMHLFSAPLHARKQILKHGSGCRYFGTPKYSTKDTNNELVPVAF